jgi:hypothetical protein
MPATNRHIGITAYKLRRSLFDILKGFSEKVKLAFINKKTSGVF